MVWAVAFERALDHGYSLNECVSAAHRAVVELRNCAMVTVVVLNVTDDAKAMLEDMLGVSR